MRFRCFLLVVALLPSLAVAQYNSRLNRFQVDEKQGCAPFTLNIHHLLPGHCFQGGFPCAISWGDGTPPQVDSTYTYTQPGTYVLSILYQSPLGSDDITITVTPNTQPAFDVFTCSGGEVQVRVTDSNYDAYIINYNDATPEVTVPEGSLAVDTHPYALGPHTISVRGKNVDADDNCTPPATKSVTAVNGLTTPFINLLTVSGLNQIDLDMTTQPNVLYRVEIAPNSVNPGNFQLIQTIHDVSTTTVTNTNINTDNNYYCFRVGAFDPCNNTTLYSNIICSTRLQATPQNGQNNLVWATNALPAITNFSVERNGAIIGTTAASPYNDPSVCKTDSCYRIITNYTNTSQSISSQKCVTAISTLTPTAIDDVTAVVGNESVDLTWLQNPAFLVAEYSVFRKSGSGNYSLHATVATTQLTDDTYTTEGEFCYRINYDDICGNASDPGADVCPIRLSGSLDSDNFVTLNWNDYAGWSGGVNSYTVEKYDGQGVPLQTFNVGTATTLLDNSLDPTTQLFVYIVRADANDAGLGQAVSNEFTIIKEPHLYYPKAFTPNGDNLNDVFNVFGDYVVEFEMNIFNRWGELLFTTNDLEQGWDGKFKGTTQPEGTYTFVANLTDLAGRSFKRSGSVVLLRHQ